MPNKREKSAAQEGKSKRAKLKAGASKVKKSKDSVKPKPAKAKKGTDTKRSSNEKGATGGRRLSRLEAIDDSLAKGLERVCLALGLDGVSSQTSVLASKLLQVSVRDLVKWIDHKTIPETEWVRWAAACIFIVQRSRNLAGHPKEIRSLRQLLVLVTPETLLGFLERCDCVVRATDPLVWQDAEMMTSAVKSIARFRRSVALTYTMRKSFEKMYYAILDVNGVAIFEQQQTMSERLCWTAWCYFRKRLWKNLTNPVELLHTELALLFALFHFADLEALHASGALEGDLSETIDWTDFSKPINPNSESNTSHQQLQNFIRQAHPIEADLINPQLVLSMSSSVFSSIPETMKGLFERRFCISVDVSAIQAMLHPVTAAYSLEYQKEVLGLDERGPFNYCFEAESLLAHLRQDNCAIWVCQQVNRYSQQLFSEEIRKVMRSCVPDPTGEIEDRIESMVREFGAHCPVGVSDYRGTTALYSAFFDAIVDAEIKAGRLLGGALLHSDTFHRTLFALAAHVMGYFAPLPKYPDVLTVCHVQALDFFKGAYLLVETLPVLLPDVLKSRVKEAMSDIIYRRGWWDSERFASAGTMFKPMEVASRVSSSSFAQNSPLALEGDDVFTETVHSTSHRLFLEIASYAGMASLASGRTAIRKGLCLLDLVLGDEKLMRRRNLRCAVICTLYCVARALQLSSISFEVLIRCINERTPEGKLREVYMDLTQIELGNGRRSNVIDFYNGIFLLFARPLIQQAGLSPSTATDSTNSATVEATEHSHQLSEEEQRFIKDPQPIALAYPQVSWTVAPKWLTAMSFVPKSKVLLGAGFTVKFLAYD